MTRTAKIDALAYARVMKDRAVRQLMQLIRIMSISTAPGFGPQIEQAGEWCIKRCKQVGLQKVRRRRIPGHPSVILAEDNSAGPKAPLLVAYFHRDVQPAGGTPWTVTSAFKPVLRGHRIFGRGAADDKGPLCAFLDALEACIKGGGRLPVRIRIIIEGEEERGSAGLIALLKSGALREFLKGAKAVLVCDTAMAAKGVPSITLRLRGAALVDLLLKGPRQEGHSGHWSDLVESPVEALATIIAAMRNRRTGRIAVPGIYRGVRPLPEDVRRLVARHSMKARELLAECGAPRIWRPKGISIAEAVGAMPSMTIHAFHGGPPLEACGTMVPTGAAARISIRTVPDMDPVMTARELAKYVKAIARTTLGGTVRVDTKTLFTANAVAFDMNDPSLQLAAAAAEETWGVPVGWTLCGGSVPFTEALQRALGLDIAMLGMVDLDCNEHGPNEFLSLRNFHNGRSAIVRFLYGLAEAA